jgi:hypothetical protein
VPAERVSRVLYMSCMSRCHHLVVPIAAQGVGVPYHTMYVSAVCIFEVQHCCVTARIQHELHANMHLPPAVSSNQVFGQI